MLFCIIKNIFNSFDNFEKIFRIESLRKIICLFVRRGYIISLGLFNLFFKKIECFFFIKWIFYWWSFFWLKWLDIGVCLIWFSLWMYNKRVWVLFSYFDFSLGNNLELFLLIEVMFRSY